jgi:hypothetical protein
LLKNAVMQGVKAKRINILIHNPKDYEAAGVVTREGFSLWSDSSAATLSS